MTEDGHDSRYAELDEWFPPCGPCMFCGWSDKRHRLWDTFVCRHDAGETVEEIAEDMGQPLEGVRAVIRLRPYPELPREDEIGEAHDPLPISVRNELNRQANRYGRYRRGMVPLRKRRKRLHKKLAKRGFSASPTFTIWSSQVPGYGTRGTKYDLFYRARDDDD